jgi:hypothetical protein
VQAFEAPPLSSEAGVLAWVCCSSARGVLSKPALLPLGKLVAAARKSSPFLDGEETDPGFEGALKFWGFQSQEAARGEAASLNLL